MNVLLTLTYSVFLNEPVNVALAVEHRCADLEERDTSAWTEVFEKVHAHAEVHLRLLVREPYLLNLCYYRLFHNLSFFVWFMLWRQYRPLPASDVSEFMCSFTDEVLNVRVKFPLQGTSDCCDPYSAVLCQFNLATSPKFYSFSFCHLDYICYICILNIYWAFCERLGFVSLRSINDCKGSNNYQNNNVFLIKLLSP